MNEAGEMNKQKWKWKVELGGENHTTGEGRGEAAAVWLSPAALLVCEGLRKHLQGLAELFTPLPPCLDQMLLETPRDTVEGWKGDYEWDTCMHRCTQMCTCTHTSFIQIKERHTQTPHT